MQWGPRAIGAASEFCLAECIALARRVEARRLAAGAVSGKMLGELKRTGGRLYEHCGWTEGAGI